MKQSVLVEVRHQSAIHEDATSIFAISRQDLPSWMEEMLRYKKEGALPEDPTRAKKIRSQAPQFAIVNGKLNKIA